MSRKRHWVRLIAALAIVAGIAVPAVVQLTAQASAINRRVVKSSFTVLSGQGFDTIATCPSGTVNTGGGYFHASTTGLDIDISRPATSGQGWHVHAVNFSGTSQTVTAYAVCGTLAGRRVVSSSFTVLSGQGFDTIAACPSGMVVTGGGYFHASTTGLDIDISRPATSGQGWHVHAVNFSGMSQTITAYAVCGASS